MAQDDRPVEIAQLGKLVAWIDEQRKQDKEQIARLGQQMERLGADARDTQAQVIDLQDRLRSSQATIARVPLVDTALQQMRELIAGAQRAHQELDERESRNRLLVQAETTRATKTLSEVVAQLGEFQKRDEEASVRIQLLSEEVKHDRSIFGLLPQRIEHVEKQVALVSSNMRLADEQVKRHEGQLTALGQQIEELRVEQRKYAQWQQSAEIRWARQLAEWAQQIEQWQHLLDDQGKALHELTKNTAQTAKVSESLRQELGAQHESIEQHAVELQNLAGVQDATREEANRLMLNMDAQRRRIDEQAGVLRQLDEGLRQQSAEAIAISRRLDNEHSRVDLLATALRQREQAQHDDRGDLEALQRDSQALRYELNDSTSRLQALVAETRQDLCDQLDGLIALGQRHRRRHIESLDQELRELRDQATKVGVGESD